MSGGPDCGCCRRSARARCSFLCFLRSDPQQSQASLRWSLLVRAPSTVQLGPTTCWSPLPEFELPWYEEIEDAAGLTRVAGDHTWTCHTYMACMGFRYAPKGTIYFTTGADGGVSWIFPESGAAGLVGSPLDAPSTASTALARGTGAKTSAGWVWCEQCGKRRCWSPESQAAWAPVSTQWSR